MKVSKMFTFEASHILPRHPGKCSRLHGHSFRLLVEVWGAVVKETGFVMDYAELTQSVQPIVNRFDHQHLNCFIKYPSSENIAIHIAHELLAKIQCERLHVGVSETQKTWANWDSADKDDLAIVTQFTLDTDPDAWDAEWRSPQIGEVAHVPSAIEELEALSPVNFASWEMLHTKLVQLRLYRDSLGKPGAIQEELQPYLAQNEKAQG